LFISKLRLTAIPDAGHFRQKDFSVRNVIRRKCRIILIQRVVSFYGEYIAAFSDNKWDLLFFLIKIYFFVKFLNFRFQKSIFAVQRQCVRRIGNKSKGRHRVIPFS